VKKILVAAFCLLVSVAGADPLWEKAVAIYGSHLNNRPKPVKTYMLMETGVPGGESSKNEVFEEYKFEGDQAFRKVLKVLKDGAEMPIPPEAAEKWHPVDPSKPDKKSDYNGMDQIFMQDRQDKVKFEKTGNSKTIFDKACQEYSFTLEQERNGKMETVVGKTYLEETTGAPYEIRRHNTSEFMKGSPDSFVSYSYDGEKLYPRHFMLVLEMNLFGNKKFIKTEAKLDY